MSRRVVTVALLACVVVAGCGGPDAGTTTETVTDANRVVAAPVSATGTTAGTASNRTTTGRTTTAQTTNRTTTGTYEKGLDYEVRASNEAAEAQTVSVSITPENDSTPVFDRSIRLAANESKTFDVAFPHAGTYEVSVVVGDANATRRWTIATSDPDDALSIHVSAEGEVYVGFVVV